MIAVIDPAAVPALQVAGAFFLIINVLAGAWAWHHRRQLFGPDSTAEGDRPATWSATLTLGADLALPRRDWPRHPHCGCSWA